MEETNATFKLNFELQLDVLVSPVDCFPKTIVLIAVTHAGYLFVSFFFEGGGVCLLASAVQQSESALWISSSFKSLPSTIE